MLLAQREATTSLARIAAATGTVPYSGRLHPDGSWRGHVAGPGAAKLLGGPYSAAAWARAVHPDDAAAFAEACQRAARGEPSEVEYRIVRPDGETREIWDRFAPSRGGTVAGVRVDVHRAGRATERQLSSRPAPPGERAAPAGRVVVTLEVLPDGPWSAVDPVGTRRTGTWAAARGERPPGRPRRRSSRRWTRSAAASRVAIGIRQSPTTARCAGCAASVPREEPDGRRFADVIVSDVTDGAELTAELAATRSQLDRVLVERRGGRLHARAGRGDGRTCGEMSYVGPGWERVTGSDRTTPRAMASG